MMSLKRFPIFILRKYKVNLRLYGSQSNIDAYDIGNPPQWYESARKIRRTITFHCGPTNSGKTYQALKELISSKTGCYCGPLRLLAWEVYDKLRQEQLLCNLITGNEKEILLNSTHTSSTVEMVDLQQYYDIAIIDEIQMIGDNRRGWAWSQALLGILSPNVHVCGSSNALPILKSICKQTNDVLIIKSYERLSPLTISKSPLTTFKNIQAGDCIVSFSRRNLYRIKKEIESKYPGNHCCVIYGNLPPIARKDQAKLFSSPNNRYNCLVATDAIGMGLNLSIKRIIFSTMSKFDGSTERLLYPSVSHYVSLVQANTLSVIN